MCLIGLFNGAYAETKKIFMGYTASDKERYLYINDVEYAMMRAAYYDNGKQIFNQAVTCMNDSYWYKVEMLSFRHKDDFYAYKFKFYWLLDSKIVYVDLNGDTLSCREGL